jgi:hypothetical protein
VIIIPVTAIRAECARFAGWEIIMTKYVGLDVSQKTTVLCIVDGEGHRLWRGECTSSPDQIVHAVLQLTFRAAGGQRGVNRLWQNHQQELAKCNK